MRQIIVIRSVFNYIAGGGSKKEHLTQINPRYRLQIFL